jgi:hypothetical protein
MRGSRHHRAHVHIHNRLQTGATQRAGLRLAQHNFGNFSFTALDWGIQLYGFFSQLSLMFISC